MSFLRQFFIESKWQSYWRKGNGNDPWFSYLASVANCMLVEIFTNTQVGSDLITDDWLNTMFPFTIYVRNLLLIKFSIFNLFLNGFHSKGAIVFRDLILVL